jgi:hypothetical protein
METAEPRYADDFGWLASKIDPWMNNDEEFVDYGMQEVEEQYRAVKGRDDGDFSRYLKDAMLHVAAVSYDAVLEGELERDVFDEVLASTRDHVVNHYFESMELQDLVIPDLGRSTRQFSRQGTSGRQIAMDELAEAAQDGRLEDWYREETDANPDRVVGVPGGGIEAGIIASEALGTELDLIRCSPRKRDETGAHAIESRDYSGENILVVDDIRDEGRAEDALKTYLDDRGAGNVVFDAGIPEWSFPDQ